MSRSLFLFICVLDEDNYLNGILPVKALLTAAEDMFVADVMRQTYFSVSPTVRRVYELISNSRIDTVPGGAVRQTGRYSVGISPELIEDERTQDAAFWGGFCRWMEPYPQAPARSRCGTSAQSGC